jgi:PleD family two-component response regulator
LCVLVVEDNEAALAATLEIIELLGHRACGVDTAELALKALVDSRFDVVLTDVAAMLKKSIRASDMVCRFGGEEFVLVLTDATRASASRRCEEIRAAIRELEPTYRGRGLGNPTASFGVALFPDHAADADSLINASDEALYEAKYAGRDRIVISKTEAGGAEPR